MGVRIKKKLIIIIIIIIIIVIKSGIAFESQNFEGLLKDEILR